MSSDSLPKAILYSWPSSVWSTVPRLCLHEKGYGDDEYIVKPVDITKGENFSPSYLKINMNGTIPTLVVPMLETTGPEVDSRYRSLRDTVTICDFLNSARNSHTTNTTSDKPAPSLSPATIEGKAASDTIINLVHLAAVDPNFLHIAARDAAQLKSQSNGFQGTTISQRRNALVKYVEEAKKIAAAAPSTKGASADGLTYEQKMVKFLEEKHAANELLWEIYNGQGGEAKEKSFIEAGKKSWTESVPEALEKIVAGISGPFVLGDQICLADLHLIAWLARLVAIAGGSTDAESIELLEKATGKKVDEKLKTYWSSWTKRASFQQVYTKESELQK